VFADSLSKTKQVHLALFMTMMVWGVNLSAVKGLTETLDILLVAAIRMVIAAVVMAVMAWQWGRSLTHWKSREWLLLVVAAFFLVYGQQILFSAGLAKTSATNAALVLALGPMVSLSLEAMVFRRPIFMRQFIGMALALAGIAAVILNRPHAVLTSAAWGDVWIFLSVMGFALGGLCIQRLTLNSSPLSVTFVVHFVGALMLCLHVIASVDAPVDHLQKMNLWQWSLAGFSAVFATGIGSVVWSRGISTIGVGRTASYISLVPIFGVLYGALFFSEPVTEWHAIGLLGVIGGSMLIVRR
jgi:drug/metabolite transporter (DMT)-like permease